MKINVEGIQLLLEIFENNKIDYTKIVEFAKTKAMSGFTNHEKSFNREINKTIIIDEIIRLKKENDYRDRYGFYLLKEKVTQFKKEIQYIEENQDKIINGALDNVYNYIPKEIKIQPKIYLYAGGIDGGFTVNRKHIFINYLKYINELGELTKVISHELFHCRNINLNSKVKSLLFDNMNNRYTYEVLGKILEEGIACLIQHGNKLEIDDPVGTITKEKMKLIDIKLEQLNNILLGTREGNIDYIQMDTLDIYTLGYFIANSLYKFYGKDGLFPWIEKYDYKKPIKLYIEAMKQRKRNTGFTKEIEMFLLNI